MKINWKKLIKIIVITFVIGGLFSFLTMTGMDTYKELNKPINVPGIVFPIVWSTIFLLISISLYIIEETNSVDKKEAKKIYYVSLVINSLWTLIFFGFKLYLFSFIWLLILLGSIIFMFIVFLNIRKASAYLLIPYILWVIFAGYLNFGIYLLNR